MGEDLTQIWNHTEARTLVLNLTSIEVGFLSRDDCNGK
jgi:hypothetical protein